MYYTFSPENISVIKCWLEMFSLTLIYCIFLFLGEAPAYVNMNDLANMAANKRRESGTDLSPQPGSTEVFLVTPVSLLNVHRNVAISTRMHLFAALCKLQCFREIIRTVLE